MKKFLLFFILALSLVSCGQVSSPPWLPGPEKLDKLFGGKSPQVSPNQKPINEISAYLDASASISGFASENSVFCRMLREISSSPEALAQLKFYKFGETVTPISSERIWEEASRRDFYNQRWTKFSQLLSQKLKSAPKRKIFLVITDGVQSLKEGYNLSRMVQALADGIRKGWQTEIIGFKSQFDGKIYSEQDENKRFIYQTGGNPALYRPFYLFVFAPDKEALENFNQLLSKSTGLTFNLFNPGQPAAEDYRGKTLPPPEPMILFKRDSISRGIQLVPVDYLAVLNPRKVQQKIFDLKTSLDFLKASPLITGQSSLRAVVTGLFSGDDKIWKPLSGDNLIFEPEIQPQTPAASQTGKPAEEKPAFSYSITWHFNPPEKPGWYVYRIRYYPKIGSLALPQWVNEWSTDNDQYPVYANRTLYFSQLVQLLLNQVTLEQPVGEHYIAIYWGGK